jgi:MFS family permease
VIGLVALYRIFGNLIATAWGSLMSDYLPAEVRGSYFGRRSQLVGSTAVLGVSMAGVFLFAMKRLDAGLGFFILFLGSLALRSLSAYLLSKMHEPGITRSPESDFTFLMFIRRFRESNFVKFVLYVSSMTFATFVASPYFSVYMLRDLGFNYVNYMLVHLAAVVTSLLSFPIWGRHADVVGNAKILKITSLLIPLIPLCWLLSRNPYYLMLAECFSGFVWGGFNLCTSNFIYDAVSPEKRVRCLGYFNMINGAAVFLGTSLGGFLGDRLAPFLGFPLLSLFLLSAALRFFAHFFLSRGFHEVRQSAQRVSSSELFFSVIGVRPMSGLDRE